MEFKLRLNKKKKAQKVRNRENEGFKRIKIRGRKRWIKMKKAAEENKAS